MRSAKSCLKKLGTYQEFDYVGADDGVKRPKPEADMFLEFQHKFNLKPEEIAVVGDTYNDVVFARNNGGIAIGVLSGVSSEEDFRGEADYILDSVKDLARALLRGWIEKTQKKAYQTRMDKEGITVAEIQLNHVYKKFEDGVTAVKNFTLDIHDRDFVVFVGPSGCGKSTTLRMIAGL